MKVEYDDTDQMADDWRQDVKVDPELDAFCYKFVETITEFESMFDVSPGFMIVAKMSIKLKSDETIPIIGALCEADSRAHEFKTRSSI